MHGAGEMIAGPKRTLFADEISTGLDRYVFASYSQLSDIQPVLCSSLRQYLCFSSTTFQIVRGLRDLVQLGSATAIIALLQPAPEVYELFDEVMLLSEGEGRGKICQAVG